MSSESIKSGSRIAIVGVGQVGGAAAYSLIPASIASELLLVDTRVDFRDGQVQDLSDVAYSSKSRTRVRAGTYSDASQCDIVIITVGSRYTIGETSLGSLYRNVALLRNVIDAMTPFKSDAILLVVSNPVDLLTSIALELSGLPPAQVIGSGTFLESARIRGLISDRTGVAPNSIDAYVLGVRGDSQVVAWSSATIGGVPIDKSLPTKGPLDRKALADECRDQPQKTIRAKGSTPFGIGYVVSNICSSILLDKRNVRLIGHFQPEFRCCFSLPAVIGRKGALATIQIPLDDEEKAEVALSANELRRTLESVHEDL
ncbi:related to lactate dehydrogenase [Cephalotrichum gorgonifer]|uniref:Related to lactate dehydrogenase n=1 Tax=Cephalotrichum gorgonifer TaxID=2041049 RepID=A0AAE8MWT6_9PEZI|nr:related to lactate dehydrogenase [Cephalotrichum gorgonifer]